MASPASTEAPRRLSCDERLALLCGNEHNRRRFINDLVDALLEGPTIVESDGVAGNGRLMHAPLILRGHRPW